MGRTIIILLDGRRAVCKTRGASQRLLSAGSRFLWQRVLIKVFFSPLRCDLTILRAVFNKLTYLLFIRISYK